MDEDLHEEHDIRFYVKILKICKLCNLNQRDISWFWLGGETTWLPLFQEIGTVKRPKFGNDPLVHTPCPNF